MEATVIFEKDDVQENMFYENVFLRILKILLTLKI